MDEEITKIVLDGITFKEFVVFYAAGVAGITVRFLLNLANGIRKDPQTPNHFSWRAFLKGFIRLLASLIIMIFVIARFDEYSHLLINIEALDAQGNPAQAQATITAGLAFLVGLGIDEIVKRLVGGGIRILNKNHA